MSDLYIDMMLRVLDEHEDANKWNDSVFERIKRISNTKVGSIGQNFIEDLCDEFNIQCVFPEDIHGHRLYQNSWDIKIEGVEFELKTATEDVSGSFQFNHIRYHREYDGLICLGISPNAIFFDVWSKAEVSTGAAGRLVSMERQANASYKLTKKPRDLKPISLFHQELTSAISGPRFDFVRSRLRR